MFESNTFGSAQTAQISCLYEILFVGYRVRNLVTALNNSMKQLVQKKVSTKLFCQNMPQRHSWYRYGIWSFPTPFKSPFKGAWIGEIAYQFDHKLLGTICRENILDSDMLFAHF